MPSVTFGSGIWITRSRTLLQCRSRHLAHTFHRLVGQGQHHVRSGQNDRGGHYRFSAHTASILKIAASTLTL
jgi:hypothetical protein